MRPAQWLKNGFVLTPLVFAAKLTVVSLIWREVAVFGVFCLAASGIYLWNDILDWQADRQHPEKKKRPIPSGRLSRKVAVLSAAGCLLAALPMAFALNRTTGLLVLGYLALQVLYSIWLKHLMIVDVMCVAVGFVFRVLAGAAAIEVTASHWLLMCSFLLALFLGIAKRRQEIVLLAQDSAKHRPVLINYTLPWLDQAGTLVAASTVVSYALYAVSSETQVKFGTDRLIYTLPFVLYGILRYQYLIHSGDHGGDPTGALLTDRQLLACVGLWALSCAAIIYL